MKLATIPNGKPDGQLVVVVDEGSRAIPVADIAPTLQFALENWTSVSGQLQDKAQDCSDAEAVSFDTEKTLAPLPRAWQWLDGSAFPMHGELMQTAFNMAPIETDRPLMYQGMSDRFYSPTEDAEFPSEADGIDFEGEFGVVVDAVPMGISAEDALGHIRLIVQINDWSLRTIAPAEMKTGFGWVQAKPACSMAPLAITPDELGDAWENGRVCLPLAIDWNGERFGSANGREMEFGFHELVAHAARTRDLVAGTVIGSGTVSNAGYEAVGSSCISERRAIEMINFKEPRTPFLSFGDRVRMEARSIDDGLLFGAVDQIIIQRS